MLFDLDRLKGILDYDKNTGNFTCLIDRSSNSRKGDIAGSMESNGYVRIVIDGKKHYAHRLAYFYVYGFTPEFIDHLNGNRSDNSIKNLKASTRLENAKNKTISIRNKSGMAGVYWINSLSLWKASIKNNGNLIYLGCYVKKIDAMKARKNSELKYGYSENHGAIGRKSYHQSIK